METKRASYERPKMRFLESAHNEIVSTIASRPSESGGLLFGSEDDYVVRKFVFDQHAKVTRSTYSFNTDFLNPEIRRLWKEEGLSCIGFIHSHPPGFNRPSGPDIEYFSSMFECMPRKQYLVPIVFTAPDGGYKLNAHILPNGAKTTIIADVEILPDDYYEGIQDKDKEEDKEEDKKEDKKEAQAAGSIVMQTPAEEQELSASQEESKKSEEEEVVLEESPAETRPPKKHIKNFLSNAETINSTLWMVWKLTMAGGFGWFFLKACYILTNQLSKIVLQ